MWGAREAPKKGVGSRGERQQCRTLCLCDQASVCAGGDKSVSGAFHLHVMTCKVSYLLAILWPITMVSEAFHSTGGNQYLLEVLVAPEVRSSCCAGGGCGNSAWSLQA
jgi:hypothetical protein